MKTVIISSRVRVCRSHRRISATPQPTLSADDRAGSAEPQGRDHLYREPNLSLSIKALE